MEMEQRSFLFGARVLAESSVGLDHVLRPLQPASERGECVLGIVVTLILKCYF